MPELELPEYGKHIVFLGSTGSGKSVLASAMLRYYDAFFAIDTQDSLDIPGKVLANPRHLGLLLRFYPKLHYVPKPEFIERYYFEHVFRTLLNSSQKKKPRPRIIYIDEIYHVGYGMSFPAWLPKAITTARQRKLSFWISTQRPRAIPVPVMSEASKIIVFYLSKGDDIKLVSEFARSDKKGLFKALSEQEDDYSFIVVDNRKGTWSKYPKLKLNEGE